MTNHTIEAIMRLSAKLGSLSAFDKMAGKLDHLDRKAKTFNRTQGVLARTQGALNGVMAAGAGRLLAAGAATLGGTEAIRDFAAAERRLTRMGLNLGATREEMQGLDRDIAMNAKRYGLLSDQVTETAASYAAAGASLADIRADIGLLAKAQQALDASGADTVNSWDSARKSLGLVSKDAEKFFEIVAAGASAGKFEAKDMAQFLPSLLPSASKQGVKGLEGAKQMVAFLETMADFTGSPGQAATAVGDLLEKLSSPDVEKRFAEINVNLPKALREARKEGKDLLTTVNQLLTKATGGDATRLGAFFGDKEARSAATVLLMQMDKILAAQDKIAANAPGVLSRNNARLMEDAQGKLDHLLETYGRFEKSVGGFLVDVGAASAMESISTDYDRFTAARAGGWTPWDSLKATLTGNDPRKVVDAFAWKGGGRTATDMLQIEARRQYAVSRANMLPREPSYGFGVDAHGLPYPAPYGAGGDSLASPALLEASRLAGPYQAYGARYSQPPALSRRERGDAIGAMMDSGGDANYDEFQRAVRAGADEFRDGGREAGTEAGNIFKQMLAGMGKQFGAEAAATFNANIKVPSGTGLGLPAPRANTGQSRAGSERF